jgi:hypothetical protein
LRRLLPDWSLRLALQVGLRLEVGPQLALVPLEVVPPLRVGLVAAVAVPAANWWQAPAALRVPDLSAPEQPDSYHRLSAVLVLEAELARVKSTPTRL